MLHMKYFLISTFLLGFALGGCVSEIDFELSDSSFVIIDGVITNSADERRIFVRKRRGERTEEIRSGLSGKLFKNGNFLIDLLPDDNALIVPAGVLIEVGASYHIEVNIGEEESYFTLPQKVMPALKTDSLSFDLENKPIEPTPNGFQQSAFFVNLYAHITVPEVQEDKVYYRWQVDESWNFRERPSSNPFHTPKTCYFSRNFRLNESTIFQGNDLAAGPVTVLIDDTPFGEAFISRHYFSAYTHSITEEAYIFYEKVRNSNQQQGDLFQEVPAPIPGNIRSVDGTGSVLGFVEFSIADTLRIAVTAGELNRPIFLECEEGSFGSAPCFDCLLKPGAFLERPFYWD